MSHCFQQRLYQALSTMSDFCGALSSTSSTSTSSSTKSNPSSPPDPVERLNLAIDLHYAAVCNNDVETVRYCLSRNVDTELSMTPACGRTPLMWAIIRGYVEVVRVLVEEGGANVNARCCRSGVVPQQHYTPLLLACRSPRCETMIRILLPKTIFSKDDVGMILGSAAFFLSWKTQDVILVKLCHDVLQIDETYVRRYPIHSLLQLQHALLDVVYNEDDDDDDEVPPIYAGGDLIQWIKRYEQQQRQSPCQAEESPESIQLLLGDTDDGDDDDDDDSGRLALHWALAGVVKAAASTNAVGKMALSTRRSSTSSSSRRRRGSTLERESLKVALFLLDRYPASGSVPDPITGQTPLEMMMKATVAAKATMSTLHNDASNRIDGDEEEKPNKLMKHDDMTNVECEAHGSNRTITMQKRSTSHCTITLEVDLLYRLLRYEPSQLRLLVFL